MDVFKTRPGINESIPVNNENYMSATKKLPPFCRKRADGSLMYYGVCPLCDNPVQLIGLFKSEPDSIKPYARHHKGTIENLAEYDEEAYFACPYANPGKSKANIRRKPDSKTVALLYNLLRDQFDRIIYILEKTTGIKISEAFAEKLLKSYVVNEGWMYYDSTQDNLPYMLLYAEPAYSIINRLVEKDSDLYKGILENCSTVELQSVNKKYSKVVPKDNRYTEVKFILAEHHNRVEDNHLTETFSLHIIESNNIVYSQKIEVDPDFLRRLQKLPEERSLRNRKLLQIAEKVCGS